MLSPKPNDDGVINLTFSFFISTGCGMLAGFSPKSTSQSRSGKMDSPENLKRIRIILEVIIIEAPVSLELRPQKRDPTIFLGA